jgi:hypothetical protein
MHFVSYVRGRGISFLYVHKILIVLLTRDIAFRRLSLWDWDPVVVWAPPARQQQEDHALAVSPLSPTCSHRITWPAPRDHPFAVYAQVDLSTHSWLSRSLRCYSLRRRSGSSIGYTPASLMSCARQSTFMGTLRCGWAVEPGLLPRVAEASLP